MPKTLLSVASGPGIGLATVRRFGRERYRVLAARNVARRLNRHLRFPAQVAT